VTFAPTPLLPRTSLHRPFLLQESGSWSCTSSWERFLCRHNPLVENDLAHRRFQLAAFWRGCLTPGTEGRQISRSAGFAVFGFGWRTEVDQMILRLRGSMLSLVVAALAMQEGPAAALEEQRGEMAAIKACDQRLCAILMQKNPSGEDLKCTLTKTWAKSTIKEAESRRLTWGFGDARCSVEINLSRAQVVSALTSERQKLFVPPHTANCVVEQDGKLEKVTAVVAPKIVFKDGKADKVWVNLSSVEGPAGIRATLQTAAQLADSLGLFHRQMIKAINRHIERHCPNTYPQLVAASPPQPLAKGKGGSK
jgi:hypothetical protein